MSDDRFSSLPDEERIRLLRRAVLSEIAERIEALEHTLEPELRVHFLKIIWDWGEAWHRSGEDYAASEATARLKALGVEIIQCKQCGRETSRKRSEKQFCSATCRVQHGRL